MTPSRHLPGPPDAASRPNRGLPSSLPGTLDAVIIGGGPAGSAAAIELASAGLRVALIERSSAPHDKLCGDFLSAETVASLHTLGLDPASVGALSIDHVRFAGPLGLAASRLPFTAQSLSRRVLDDALLDRASAAGALVLRGHAAEALHRGNAADPRSCWSVAISSAHRSYSLTARSILLATGKHDLRGLPRPAGEHTDLVGLKMYLQLTPAQTDALRGTIELILISDARGRPLGYGGLSLVDKPSRIAPDNPANLCFVLPRSAVRNLGRDWSALCELLSRSPHLRQRLDGSDPLLARPLAISPIPYGLLRRHAIADRLYAIGDQTVVIPSFTGDGLALSLHTGRLAARAILAGRSADHFHAELHTQLRGQMRLATFLSRALVCEPHRSLLNLATRLFPGILRLVASRTRIPPKHRLPAALPVPNQNSHTLA